MKHKTIKKFLLLGILFLSCSLFLWNCEEEKISHLVLEENIITAKKAPFSELPKRLVNSLKKLKSKVKNLSRQDDSLDNIVIFDESQIVMLVDSLGGINYSIKISFEGQPENFLYNLILGIDSSGMEVDPYVMKYTIHNYPEIDTGSYLNLEEMVATIDIYGYDNFLQYATNYLSDSARTADPCPRTSFDFDGGELDNSDNPNDDNEDEGCHGDIWWNGTTGEVHTITWECEDGSSGSIDVGRSNDDCPRPDNNDSSGSAGINQGNSCPDGMSPDSNGICSCNAGSYYAGTEGCLCNAGFVRNLQGNCINQCNDIRTQLSDSATQARMVQLNASTALNHETGFKQNGSGAFTALPLVNSNRLNLLGVIGHRGYMHSHVNPYTNSSGILVSPIHMFSPADVQSFLVMVKTALQNGNSIDDIYGTMVSISGTYTLKFTGDPSTVPNAFNLVSLSAIYRKKMSRKTTTTSREEAFLKFLRDNMGVQGIQLYKVNSSGTHELKKLDSSDNLVSENC